MKVFETPRPDSNNSDRRQRSRWMVYGFWCVMVFALAAIAAGRPEPQAESNGQSAMAEPDDLVYDSFLQEFGALRSNAPRRRYLAAEVVSAATQHHLDPDLLFALVAAESSFDPTAVSAKGARGLGQLMFPTARAVAPKLVRQPDDLHNVRRNLHVTARHLRELLLECDGDLRKALTKYNAGTHCDRATKRDDNRYVASIATYFASLKVKRRYQELAAMEHGAVATIER
jgi:soluble lytic murein transglycosylase-like protein